MVGLLVGAGAWVAWDLVAIRRGRQTVSDAVWSVRDSSPAAKVLVDGVVAWTAVHFLFGHRKGVT